MSNFEIEYKTLLEQGYKPIIGLPELAQYLGTSYPKLTKIYKENPSNFPPVIRYNYSKNPKFSLMETLAFYKSASDSIQNNALGH